MSLRFGREYLAIPGPSVMPDRVLQAMHRAAPNIYSGELPEITHSLVPDLKAVARTAGDVAIYIANGHGAWEASLANVIAPGDHVLVLSTGRFGQGWGEVAQTLGAQVEVIDFGTKSPWDLAQVEERLRQDRNHQIKAVLGTHVDTSTSYRNDVPGLRHVLDTMGHPALLMVDCIASLACDRFEMDAWGVDVMVAGCQKGLMTPPGLSFVFFNENAARVRDNMARVPYYWDWQPRANPQEFYQFFGGTAATHHVYGLREALTMLVHEEGLDNALNRHQTLARAVWAAAECWGEAGAFALNVPDPAFRSHAVTAAQLPGPNGTALRDWTQENLGLTLGIGMAMAPSGDPAWHNYFRLGHMGHLNGHMLLGLLGGVEAGLKALDIPHGDGALAAAAKVIAQA